MNILIMPDSFKGTLDAATIADTLQGVLRQRIADCVTRTIPIADGGEGLVDCFARLLGGVTVTCTVTGPLGQAVQARYLLCGTTAVVEMAQAAGLPLAYPPDPLGATTYGVGQLVADAGRRGAKHILLGLGGSATTDGGCGMAAALGVGFADKDGHEFVPTGGTLAQIATIRPLPVCPDIVGLCDVRNPLFGPNGAAAVYGPQKGADPATVALLDKGLMHLAMSGDPALATTPGAGAAGGLGYGILRWVGGRLQRGIDAVLDAADYDALVQQADYVITGEGCLDSQSLSGKVIDGIVARRGPAKVLAVVGRNKLDDPAAHHIEAVFETARYLNGESIQQGAMRTLLCAAKDLADYLCSHAV